MIHKTITHAIVSVTLGTGMLLSIGAGMASAASSTDQGLSQPVRAQVSIFSPSKSDYKNLTSSSQLGLGFSWDFREATGTESKTPVRLSLFGDFTTVKKHGNEVTKEGVGIGGRFYFAPLTSSVAPYVGLGGAYYNIHTNENGAGKHDSTKPAARISAGVDMSNGVFVEASFTSMDTTKFGGTNTTLDPSGYEFSLGYKF